MERNCTKCGALKTVEADFYQDKAGKHGHSAICKVCVDKKKLEWLSDPGNQKRNAEGAHRRYLEQRMERKNYSLLKAYGVDLVWYQGMLDKQGGVCAICGTSQPGNGDSRRKFFAVDHNHHTGAVRGLLCITCNMVLGGIDDDVDKLERTRRYLEKYNRVDPDLPPASL